MGSATEVLASLSAKAATREPSAQEFEDDLLALPNGDLVPLFQRPADPAPRVIAQAPEQVWD